MPNGSAIALPSGMTARWSFRAISWGVGEAIADVAVTTDGPTGARVATALSADANTGALLALRPASSP
jgi:hypothetical protein